jgi:6-phosphofructokinase 1
MPATVLVVHGGGPTAVINASLYGVISAARRSGARVLGALGGTDGILRERFIDFGDVDSVRLERLPFTPASAIGTSRRELAAEDYARMADVCRKHGIGGVLFNGGNGTMEACGKLCRAAEGTGIRVVGIPKTIDNDIAVTDHTPGYGSAARYAAQTVAEICQDVRALPIHVSIVETLGRNAGWIAGAAAFAKTNDPSVGPHMILLPEQPFEEEAFLEQVSELSRMYGGVVVVVNEGLKNRDGTPVAGVIFKSDRSEYVGDVGSHLAGLVIRRLGIKARSEKPGLAGRASIAHQSSVDREEAVLAGEEAFLAVEEGVSGVMIGFERLSTVPYAVRIVRIPIEQVMLTERVMPFSVGDEFMNWCRPLLGGDLLDFTWFRQQQ